MKCQIDVRVVPFSDSQNTYESSCVTRGFRLIGTASHREMTSLKKCSLSRQAAAAPRTMSENRKKAGIKINPSLSEAHLGAV